MSDTSAADGFDAEFDAARDEDDQNPGLEADGGDEDAGEAAGAGEGKAAKEPLPYETLQRRLSDQQKATKAERRSRQQLERRLEALERTGATGGAQETAGATLNRLAEGMPDPDEDPIGALQHLKKVVAQFDAQSESEERQTAAQRAQQQQVVALARRMEDFEEDFRDDHPDYNQAAEHFKKARAEELAAEGLQGPALVSAMQQEFIGMIARAMQAGKDPAEVVYNLARKRGYNVSAVDPAGRKLQQIEQGQRQARTLPNGSASGSPLTFKTVADLSGDDFDKAFDKLRRQERGKR